MAAMTEICEGSRRPPARVTTRGALFSGDVVAMRGTCAVCGREYATAGPKTNRVIRRHDAPEPDAAPIVTTGTVIPRDDR